MMSGAAAGMGAMGGMGWTDNGHMKYPKDQKVWLGNLPTDLPADTIEEQLKEHLALAGGTVLFCAKMKGGTGVGVFENAEQASDAIVQLNGTQLGENTIEVDVWTSK